MNKENKNTNTVEEEKETKKGLGPCVTEDPGNALARLRADALLAVATDAAACLQLERLRAKADKAGDKEAKAVAAGQGPLLIRSMAILAVASTPAKVSAIAQRHWSHAHSTLLACQSAYFSPAVRK